MIYPRRRVRIVNRDDGNILGDYQFEVPIEQPIDVPRHIAVDTERLRRARGDAYLARQRIARLEAIDDIDPRELARERRLLDLFEQVVATLMDV